jgi:hypothetical protein
MMSCLNEPVLLLLDDMDDDDDSGKERYWHWRSEGAAPFLYKEHESLHDSKSKLSSKRYIHSIYTAQEKLSRTVQTPVSLHRSFPTSFPFPRTIPISYIHILIVLIVAS